MRGAVLYPLNRLEGIYPDLYEEWKQNYVTRPDIAALRIPPLDNCLWNDVLHMSPVHPARLKAALAKAGHELHPEWRAFFQIDASLLDPVSAVLYHMKEIFWSGRFDIDEASLKLGSECEAFRPELLESLSEIPELTRNHYASVQQSEGHPLYFLGIPHILYKGEIDTAQEGISIVEV